jgi:hypothetical protein
MLKALRKTPFGLPYCYVCIRAFTLVVILLQTHTATCAVSQKTDTDFICGGKVETNVWQLWDSSAKEYLIPQFSKRLKDQGDTYALYDVQTYIHNLIAMARRCQRLNRLQELAEELEIAYVALEPYPDGSATLAWVCKGGAICNNKNRLINQEIILTSAQFLALTTSVANGLVHAPNQHHNNFIEQTAIIGFQHLLRWGDPNMLRQLDKQISAKAEDVKDRSSALFFTDKYLWMIAMYADLAGLLQKQPSLRNKAALNDEQILTMREHFLRLLQFFANRTNLTSSLMSNGKKVKTAVLDRGFWRLYKDNKYAGYTGIAKPVTCTPKPDGTFMEKLSLDINALTPVNDIGWDISHSRRLVHVFNAIEYNRQAIQQVFSIEETSLPSVATMRAFAKQLMVHVWNGNSEFPLFTNYWNGANGWYRVAYDNGTNRCIEGYPPFGLTDSFATGGYISWGVYVPEIRIIGQRLYRLSMSKNESHLHFMKKYYPKLADNKMLTQLMFWPSLVEVTHR